MRIALLVMVLGVVVAAAPVAAASSTGALPPPRPADSFGFAGPKPPRAATASGIARPSPAPRLRAVGFGFVPRAPRATVAVTPPVSPSRFEAASRDRTDVPTAFWSSGYHDGRRSGATTVCRTCDPCDPCVVDPCPTVVRTVMERPVTVRRVLTIRRPVCRTVTRCAPRCAPCISPCSWPCGWGACGWNACDAWWRPCASICAPRLRVGFGWGWGWGGCW